MTASLAAARARQWVDVGHIEEIPLAGARVVRAQCGDIAVFRARDGHVFALADRCPHRGGPLSQGIVFGHRVACPLHDWVIDLTCGRAVAPDEGCTDAYEVKVENGRVLLALDETTGTIVRFQEPQGDQG